MEFQIKSIKMSSRGRGFNSRGGGGGGGSYRGRGGGSDWGSGSGNVSRGGYSSSRGGRFKYSTPSYDSRNKYNSSKIFYYLNNAMSIIKQVFIYKIINISGGSERYSSRGGRGDHSNNYKRQRVSEIIIKSTLYR